MADIVYRANLKAASFPMLSEQQGRSIIVRQQDQNFIQGLAAKEALESSIGVPQIYYAHNVMATEHGYQSVGYTQRTNNAELPGDFDFLSIHIIRDSLGNVAHIANTLSGKVYIFTLVSGKWEPVAGAPAANTVAGKRVTVATASGVSYIYFANTGCYFYDFTAATLVAVTLTGVDATTILGIVGSFGYLLAYSKDAIAWSSTIDATDFVPSLETGAGGGNVEVAKGAIKLVETVYGALIIFTSSNAVAAVYSGNIRYPFNFSEILGAGGLSNTEYVSYAEGSALYAYTTSGLQAVNAKTATSIFPEVTDFLSGSRLEDFDEITDTFSVITTSGAIQKRLAIIANRYVILSYGAANTLTHAIIYDIAYKQFGRLKIDHVDCFEFQLYDQTTLEVPRKSIGFLQANGTIKVVNFDIEQPAHTGVLLLGKFQYVRTRLLQLQAVELENIDAAAPFSCIDLPALDGKTFQAPVVGYLAVTSAKYRRYNFHTTGINHSILCKGQFSLVSVVLTFNVHGGR